MMKGMRSNDTRMTSAVSVVFGMNFVSKMIRTLCLIGMIQSIIDPNNKYSYYTVHGLVSYPSTNRTVIAGDITGNVNRINVEDINFDGKQDVSISAQYRLSTIRQANTATTRFGSPNNYGKYVHGVEASDFLQQSSSTGSIVIVCSSVGLSGKDRPTGALQLVREPTTTGGTPSVRTLITTTTLQGPTKRMTKVNGRDVKVLDIDKDRYLDIIATMSGSTSTENNVGFLVILKGSESGGYQTIVIDENLKGKATLDIGDFDQNGFLDIAVLAIDRSILFVYYQETNGTFTRKLIDDKVTSNMAITTGLFTKDIGSDIILLGRSTMTAYLSTITRDGATTGIYVRDFTKNALFNLNATLNIDNDYRWFQVRIYDVNQDGNNDIVFIHGKQNNIKWIQQLANNRIASPKTLISVSTPRSFEIGKDINNDRVSDVVVYSERDERVYVIYGKSS